MTQDNVDKVYMECVSDNPTLYDEADGYQIETKRRHQKDSTQVYIISANIR